MNGKLTVGSLFSGIGGLELGLERTGGFETKWQCEINDYARRVLAKHWPGIPIYDDVRELCRSVHPEKVDLICGGFPCQDVSRACPGIRPGLDGDRSGLFYELMRIVGVLRPRYVILENVPDIVGNGLDRVLGELSKIGYDAEWETLQANWFGLPHVRERFFLVAYPMSFRRPVFYASGCDKKDVESRFNDKIDVLAPDDRDSRGIMADYLRSDDGLSDWVDRIERLGNAVCPPCSEYIGERILESERVVIEAKE